MQPQKVLMLTQYLHIGGLERMVLNLSIALKAQGRWESQVFVLDELFGAARENDLRPAFNEAGISVTSFQKPPGFSFRALREIRRKMSADGIRVLHTHDLGPLTYGVCIKLMSFGRVRLIHTQHSFFDLSRRWKNKHYLRLFALFADEIAAVSPDTKRSYMALGVAERRIHVIPNGVSFPERGAVSAADKKRNRSELRGQLDLSAQAALKPFLECRWLLYMARVHRTKGQDHALELWKNLSPLARSKTVLLFVGPESDEGRLRELQSDVRKSPDSTRILYMGATNCPQLWLASTDLALSCSEYEGMPLGPIEAAGSGVPLVLSRIPGHEAMKDSSSQYPLEDPAAGARAVEHVLKQIEDGPDDYFQRTWEKGLDIRSRYTVAHMRSAYSRLYLSEDQRA
jgi:glycosyltransferase involved in cell wall biosynthesis